MNEVDAIRRVGHHDHELEFVDLDTSPVDPGTAGILSEAMARRHRMVAVKLNFGIPVIAMADPDDLFALDMIRASLGREYKLVVSDSDQVLRFVDRLYHGGSPRLAPSEPASAPAVEPAGLPPAMAGDAAFPPDEPSGGVPASSNGHRSPPPGFDTTVADLAVGSAANEVDSAASAADLVDEAVATFEGQLLEPALPSDPASTIPPLARALLEGGRVSQTDMEAVIEEHDRSGLSIARILTAKKLVTEVDLMWGMAEEMGLEFVDLDMMGTNFADTSVIPESSARHHNVLLVGDEGGVPVVAVSNPTDVFALDDLRTIMGRNFTMVVATRSQISASIGRAYGGGDAADIAETASLEYDREDPGAGVDDIQSVTEEAPIVRYVNLLVIQALNERASDIHVEPTATNLRIRYRIDGVLHDMSTAPRSIAAAVTTRLKVMADMNIAEHRIPQDGRISVKVRNKGVDLRVATLPTIHGEKIVMRVLDKSSVVLGFPDLGFDGDLLATYEGIYTKPYGTILVTGPTGSGKSTTLYTTITALNSPEKNIITVEDPVELQLAGVNQMQLNVKAGLTFASALKSILRADPDIVLVGEIRDRETAVIAVEAALTGHLVLATLHTNSAASTPMRLVEMGIQPFLVTSSLTGVLAQRLARRLCVHCREPYDVTEADIVAAGWKAGEMESIDGTAGDRQFYRATGCSACSNTGYRGRKALAELMPMTEEIERMIIEGGSVDDIHRMAVSQGMVTLRQSGLRKAAEGETTLEEVLRVVA
ncbi:MAG: GspE/PulE family protein [Acidimicrobiales bacterium]